jgi:hypothetical protein
MPRMAEGFGPESALEMPEFSAYLRILAGISAYLRVVEKWRRIAGCKVRTGRLAGAPLIAMQKAGKTA